MKFAFLGLIIFAAYKVGEQKSRVETLDFLILVGNGYLKIDANGVSITSDQNEATQFNYWDSVNMKRILKRSNPGLNVSLEGISGVINAAYV